jgi:hypothetical protein
VRRHQVAYEQNVPGANAVIEVLPELAIMLGDPTDR